MKTTRTIAGQTITLEPGVRYIAGRPLATRWRKAYPVSIRRIESPLGTPEQVVPDLPYDAANELLAAFNNGETSFEGRVW